MLNFVQAGHGAASHGIVFAVAKVTIAMPTSFSLRASLMVLAVMAALFATAQAQGIFDLPPLVAPDAASPAAPATPSQPAAPNTATAPAADPSVLTFTMSAELRATHQQAFLDSLRSRSPDAADDLAGHDLIGLLGTANAPHGLKTDNVADAFTAWLMINHGLVTGDDSDPTPAQVDGTRKLTTNALMAMPDLVASSDADKQAMADSLLLQALLNQMMIDALKQANPAGVSVAQDEIRSATRDMGLDLDLLEMTPNGLAPKQQ